jgi:hypothetical protein
MQAWQRHSGVIMARIVLSSWRPLHTRGRPTAAQLCCTPSVPASRRSGPTVAPHHHGWGSAGVDCVPRAWQLLQAVLQHVTEAFPSANAACMLGSPGFLPAFTAACFEMHTATATVRAGSRTAHALRWALTFRGAADGPRPAGVSLGADGRGHAAGLFCGGTGGGDWCVRKPLAS